MEEAKKMKCYKRLIYKKFVQISGLCGPQFLRYLPKCFTHLCSSFVELCMEKPYWCTVFFTRELAYSPINISSNT